MCDFTLAGLGGTEVEPLAGNRKGC
jgi:hypothetical protein